MNRIYQGRITRVERDADGKWEPMKEKDWQDVLEHHHALYQDAINYYIFSLLGLAHSADNPLIAHKNGLESTSQGDGMSSQEQIWTDFHRIGEKRKGLKHSIRRCFPHEKENPMPRDFWKEMYPKGVSKQILDAALQELLDEIGGGGGAIQQCGRGMFPRFCWEGFSGSFPYDSASLAKHEGAIRLGTDLHKLNGTDQIQRFAGEVQLIWVAKLQKESSWQGEESRQRLQKAIDHFEEGITMLREGDNPKGWSRRLCEFCGDTEDARRVLRKMRSKLDSMQESELPEIPKNRKAHPAHTSALLLFKHFPSDFTWKLLKSVFPQKNQTDESRMFKPSEFSDDPIKLARGTRGYVFPAFTALQHSESTNFGEPVWKEFDIAAFKEALKSIHQIELKEKEREKECEKLRHRLNCMNGHGIWDDRENENEDPPPVYAGDPRVERLETLLTKDLAQEYGAADGDLISYGLTERTFRNFPKLKEQWVRVVRNSAEYTPSLKDELLRKLKEFQTKNSHSMGSAKLYEALMGKENWIIWKTPSSDTLEAWRGKAKIPEGLEFGDDPLKVYAHKAYLERRIARLSEPVRLTPADPVMSPRHYCFSDIKGSFNNRGFGHDCGESLVVNVAGDMDGHSWHPTKIRIFYSAPRLRRDGLRSSDGDVVAETPFLQPMMEGLGYAGLRQVEFRKHAVSLMPRTSAKARRFLLNFAPDIASDELAKHLGKQKRWKGQFIGPIGKNLYLMWPTLAAGRTRPDEGWWWEHGKPFSCLAIDLGQRMAGAYAVVEAMPERQLKPDKPSRQIGSACDKKGHQKKWHAVVRAHGMLRLSGEDRKEYIEGSWQVEHSGKKGRNSCDEDMHEARKICKNLGFSEDEEFPLEDRIQSFPNANDHLLRIFGRARWRLRRLQGLSWRLNSEEDREDAVRDIRNSEEVGTILNLSVDKNNIDQSMALSMVLSKLEQLREILPSALEDIANRIMPSNAQCWKWGPHSGRTKSFVLRRAPASDSRGKRKRKVMGQRGLSFARVEQLERLRVQVQGLNRSIMQEPGKKPKSGSQTRGDEYPDPCPEILAKLDHMKEQRVNQTAHLILAEALGVRLRAHKKSSRERVARDIHGEYERHRDSVDFIVLEDLSRYLSSQGRPPRENSRLMQWSHRAILDKLKELAEPYGIPVVEASAAYSSRFCSRTGAVGFRAEEISAARKMEGFWRNALDKLERGESDGTVLGNISQVQKLFAVLEQNDSHGIGDSRRRALLAPRDGGPVFVSMRGDVQQADINAAINLGLRAISSPDCHTIDPKVRVVAEEDQLKVLKKSKREEARWQKFGEQPTLRISGFEDNLREVTEGRRYLTFFAVADGTDIRIRCASVDGIETKFASARELFSAVKHAQWAVANGINNRRLKEWGCNKYLDMSGDAEGDGREPDEDIPI